MTLLPAISVRSPLEPECGPHVTPCIIIHRVVLAYFPVVKRYAKRLHAGLKIFKANPHICSKTPDDQLSLLANTECCGDCISATESARCLSYICSYALLPLRTWVNSEVCVMVSTACRYAVWRSKVSSVKAFHLFSKTDINRHPCMPSPAIGG